MERIEALQNTSMSWAFAVAVVVIAVMLGLDALWGANYKILGLFYDDGIYTVVGQSLY
jgi:hypothetical protein